MTSDVMINNLIYGNQFDSISGFWNATLICNVITAAHNNKDYIRNNNDNNYNADSNKDHDSVNVTTDDDDFCPDNNSARDNSDDGHPILGLACCILLPLTVCLIKV